MLPVQLLGGLPEEGAAGDELVGSKLMMAIDYNLAVGNRRAS